MQSRNPATEEIIADYPEHSSTEIEQKLQAAAAAFLKWRDVSVSDRAVVLKRAGAGLRKHREELAKIMTAEVGKTIVSSESEISKCAATCDFFAENGAAFLCEFPIASDAVNSYVRFDPLGPVLAIMPWNFPLWQVIRFAAPALMAGNVAVLKHAPNVPGCALAIEKLFTEATAPAGVFTTLLMSDNQAAERLIDHPAIHAVTLTGSERAGMAVASAAGRVLKKSVMELGGSDAFIVLADADVEEVAKKAAEARCINNGQSCIAAKRFIVEQSAFDRFVDSMTVAMKEMKVGDPMDRATRLGPLARADLVEILHRQVTKSVEQGAKLRLGGRRWSGKGYFYEATVLTDVVPGMAAFDEETFGPVAAIVRARDAADAVNLANQSRYGLGASIWTRDITKGQLMANQIEAGGVFINGMVKSDPRLPFGGIKNSGWGRELSQLGIQEFVNIKTIWIA